MVSPLEDCMETSVKVKLKSQEKRKAIKLVPQKQTAGRITAEVGLDAKTENYTNVKAEGKTTDVPAAKPPARPFLGFGFGFFGFLGNHWKTQKIQKTQSRQRKNSKKRDCVWTPASSPAHMSRPGRSAGQMNDRQPENVF